MNFKKTFQQIDTTSLSRRINSKLDTSRFLVDSAKIYDNWLNYIGLGLLPQLHNPSFNIGTGNAGFGLGANILGNYNSASNAFAYIFGSRDTVDFGLDEGSLGSFLFGDRIKHTANSLDPYSSIFFNLKSGGLGLESYAPLVSERKNVFKVQYNDNVAPLLPDDYDRMTYFTYWGLDTTINQNNYIKWYTNGRYIYMPATGKTGLIGSGGGGGRQYQPGYGLRLIDTIFSVDTNFIPSRYKYSFDSTEIKNKWLNYINVGLDNVPNNPSFSLGRNNSGASGGANIIGNNNIADNSYTYIFGSFDTTDSGVGGNRTGDYLFGSRINHFVNGSSGAYSSIIFNLKNGGEFESFLPLKTNKANVFKVQYNDNVAPPLPDDYDRMTYFTYFGLDTIINQNKYIKWYANGRYIYMPAVDNTGLGTGIGTQGRFPIFGSNNSLGNSLFGYTSTGINFNNYFSIDTITKFKTSFGYQSLLNSTGTNNTAFGYKSLTTNTTGNFNTGVGNFALGLNTTGNYNVAVGHGAGNENINGVGNVYIGGNLATINNSNASNTLALFTVDRLAGNHLKLFGDSNDFLYYPKFANSTTKQIWHDGSGRLFDSLVSGGSGGGVSRDSIVFSKRYAYTDTVRIVNTYNGRTSIGVGNKEDITISNIQSGTSTQYTNTTNLVNSLNTAKIYTNGGIVYASTNAGVYSSNDNGVTFNVAYTNATLFGSSFFSIKDLEFVTVGATTYIVTVGSSDYEFRFVSLNLTTNTNVRSSFPEITSQSGSPLSTIYDLTYANGKLYFSGVSLLAQSDGNYMYRLNFNLTTGSSGNASIVSNNYGNIITNSFWWNNGLYATFGGRLSQIDTNTFIPTTVDNLTPLGGDAVNETSVFGNILTGIGGNTSKAFLYDLQSRRYIATINPTYNGNFVGIYTSSATTLVTGTQNGNGTIYLTGYKLNYGSNIIIANSPIQPSSGILDSAGNSGSAGQVLISSSTGKTYWGSIPGLGGTLVVNVPSTNATTTYANMLQGIAQNLSIAADINTVGATLGVATLTSVNGNCLTITLSPGTYQFMWNFQYSLSNSATPVILMVAQTTSGTYNPNPTKPGIGNEYVFSGANGDAHSFLINNVVTLTATTTYYLWMYTSNSFNATTSGTHTIKIDKLK